jgi:hypothetical protein
MYSILSRLSSVNGKPRVDVAGPCSQSANKIFDDESGVWSCVSQGVRRDLRVVPEPANHVSFELCGHIVTRIGNKVLERNIYRLMG